VRTFSAQGSPDGWRRLRVSNRLFWSGLFSEPVVASGLILLPPLAQVFGMMPLPAGWLGWLILSPVAVLLADTLHKRLLSQRITRLRRSAPA